MGDSALTSLPSSEVGAVIVNWNTPELTLRAVASLLEDGVAANRIVVVDNRSSDESASVLQASLPAGVILHVARENLGFARANNLGARALVDADPLLFLNSDAAVHRPGSVDALVRALRQARTGIAVPKLLNEDLTAQRNVVALRTPGVAFAQATALARLVPNSRQPSWGTHWDHSSSRPIQSATGAVLAVRRDLWELLGGFNEEAHLFAEDHDLCWRARASGWTTWFVAEAEFVHTGGASTSSAFDAPERAHAVARAEAQLMRRQLSPLRATLSIRLLQIGHGARWVLSRALRDRAKAAEHASFVRGFSRGRGS
jgi:N-acetylglucosaminyl-diphospho-decaprenol L-rhamnosyltransferase